MKSVSSPGTYDLIALGVGLEFENLKDPCDSNVKANLEIIMSNLKGTI